MSATDPTPPPEPGPDPEPAPAPEAAGADKAPEGTSAARNPWLWATIGVAVLAIGLGIWALHERSNADDAKSAQQAQEKQSAPATTQTQEQTTTQ